MQKEIKKVLSSLITPACISLLCMLFPESSISGVFTGYEADDEKTGMAYFGGQTNGGKFLHLFAADLKYEYLSGTDLIDVNNTILTAAAGLRFGEFSNYSVIAGITYNDKTEKDSATSISTEMQDTGGFIQLSAAHYIGVSSYELITSYTTLDSFFWGRGRYKHRLSESISAGTELYWMGNDDADSWGAGVLLENSFKHVTIGIKGGYKRTTLEESSSYYGLEAYFPF